MKLLALGSLALTALLLASCRSRISSPQAGPVDLFNGKDLTGWRAVSAKAGVTMDQVWSVRDGLIRCLGEPMGFIETERVFADFRLALEWRWAPGQTPGNSGVFLRINGPRRPLPRCIETQLKNGDAGDLYGFHGMKIDGDPARRLEVKGHELGGDFVGVKKMAAAEKPPGEWNRLEVLAQGPRVTVWVNGQKVNEAFGVEEVAGPVGLQSEGGEIHFRHVRLTPLAR